MSEEWQEKAADIGKNIKRLAKLHPELQPLASAWINFAEKHGIEGILKRKHKAVTIKKEFQRMQRQLSRQSNEIAALEYRVKTLLEH